MTRLDRRKPWQRVAICASLLAVGVLLLATAGGTIAGNAERAENEAGRKAAVERRRVQQREVDAKREQQKERAHAARIAEIETELPATLAAWRARLEKAETQAEAAEFETAVSATRAVRDEAAILLKEFREGEAIPPALAAFEKKARSNIATLEARRDFASALVKSSAALETAERAAKEKNWYLAAAKLEEASKSLESLLNAEEDLEQYLPDDLDLPQLERRRDGLAKKLDGKAVPPARITVRQYLNAPTYIREEAIAIRWKKNAADLDGLVELADELGVKGDALAGIKHCSDGLMKKDRKILEVYDQFVVDIREVAKSSAPASNAIDTCIATFAAFSKQ